MVRGDDETGVYKQLRDVLKKIRDAAPLLESDRPAFDEAVSHISQGLIRIVAQVGDLELNISTNRILTGEDEVYKSESRTNNLAFDLFRQGLRRLTLKPGVSETEVESFVRRYSECRAVDQVDEDFVTMMWQDSSDHLDIIAVDNFTEKIFMSEAEFVGRFRSVVSDVAPGLFDMSDEDVEDSAPRSRRPLDELSSVDRADLEQRKVRKALEKSSPSFRSFLLDDRELTTINGQLVYLMIRIALRENIALNNAEMQGIVTQVLTAYLEHKEWQLFSDCIRSFEAVWDVVDALSPNVRERIEKIRKVVAGRDLAEHVASNLDPEQTNFTAWARWYFCEAGELTAPALLELVNGCENPAGRDWLKDLLRRLGSESLEPWAERMRDPNPGIVTEVIDVILASGLRTQARPLLMEALKHPEGAVRQAAIKALRGEYDLSLREVLLPLLKDPEPGVRRAVVKRFVRAEDTSVGTYMANIIKSGDIYSLSEDEQRELCQALAGLTGDRYLQLFRDELKIEDAGGLIGLYKRRGQSTITDTLTRRALISGLAAMGSTEALALIREVKNRADLPLAAHCDVVLRLARRDDGAKLVLEDGDFDEEVALEDVSIGKHRMGQSDLYSAEQLGLSGLEELATSQRKKRDEQAAENAQADTSATANVQVQNFAVAPSTTSDLGPSPLLNHTETLDSLDRRRMMAAPANASGQRFQLTDVEVSIVGVAQKRARPQTTRPPVRIVETSRGPQHAPESRRPKPRVDSLLKDYLDADQSQYQPDEETFASVGGASLNDSMEDYLRDYVEDGQETDLLRNPPESPSTQAILAPPTTPKPSEPDTSPPEASGEVGDLLRAYLDSDSEK